MIVNGGEERRPKKTKHAQERVCDKLTAVVFSGRLIRPCILGRVLGGRFLLVAGEVVWVVRGGRIF